MRVVHFTRDFPPRQNGGLSTAVGSLVRALEPRDVKATVVSFDGWRPSKGGAARAGCLPSVCTPFGNLLRVTSETQPPGPEEVGPADFVHVHDAMLWPAGEQLARALGIPALYTVHSLHAHVQWLRGMSPATRSAQTEARAMAGAHTLTVASRAARDLVVRYYPEAEAKLALAPFGVHPDPHADAAVGRERAPRGIYVGRFADVKGTEELLGVIPSVLKNVPPASFSVVGGIPENARGDARWRKRWEALQIGAGEERLSLPGWVPATALGAHWAEASVSVVPSWFETFGQSALESMHWGVPVVATAVGGLPELVEDQRTGVLCSPRDPQTLGAALEAVLSSSDVARDMGAEAAREVRERWLWGQRIDAWLSAYGGTGLG